MHFEIIISLITIVLAFVAYIPYVRDILSGKTKPHTFTWLVWALAVSISAGLQIVGGAGVGAWPTITMAVVSIIIFIVSIKKGSKEITKLDVVFFILALISLFLWIVVDQPVWSVILVVTTDILGFAPTIRKSWNAPYSETLSTYEVTAVRHGLSILALQKFNILTVLYPVAWTVANIGFSLILIMRRKVIRVKKVK